MARKSYSVSKSKTSLVAIESAIFLKFYARVALQNIKYERETIAF